MFEEIHRRMRALNFVCSSGCAFPKNSQGYSAVRYVNVTDNHPATKVLAEDFYITDDTRSGISTGICLLPQVKE